MAFYDHSGEGIVIPEGIMYNKYVLMLRNEWSYLLLVWITWVDHHWTINVKLLQGVFYR